MPSIGLYLAGHTLHWASQGIEHRLGGEVLRRDEVDELFLSHFLLHCEACVSTRRRTRDWIPRYKQLKGEEGPSQTGQRLTFSIISNMVGSASCRWAASNYKLEVSRDRHSQQTDQKTPIGHPSPYSLLALRRDRRNRPPQAIPREAFRCCPKGTSRASEDGNRHDLQLYTPVAVSTGGWDNRTEPNRTIARLPGHKARLTNCQPTIPFCKPPVGAQR